MSWTSPERLMYDEFTTFFQEDEICMFEFCITLRNDGCCYLKVLMLAYFD